MIQYLDLLKKIKSSGTYKPAARANMPGTQSYFGYQFRHDLSEGFPLLTTKKMYWKGVYIELLWFLNGDTNIKYLVDHGVNIWNEDAYQYYLKRYKIFNDKIIRYSFEEFINQVKIGNLDSTGFSDYRLGDCGFQYGRVWRRWEGEIKSHGRDFVLKATDDSMNFYSTSSVEKIFNEVKNEKILIDQIADIVNALRNNPESRRHIVNAWDVAHANDLALTWCHAMFQFNCRPLTTDQRAHVWFTNHKPNRDVVDHFDTLSSDDAISYLNERSIPKYYLDCQLYQRSADVVLGVPFNIASYALLTHILAKMANMIPGEFIHTFGDVHIYDNHIDAVEEQLTRIPDTLPTLKIDECPDVDWATADLDVILSSIDGFEHGTFLIENYNPQGAIKAKLSTGLK